MLNTVVFSLAALSAVANAWPKPALQRRSGCQFYPNETLGNGSPLTSPDFVLRVEEESTNATFGYIDAFSSEYALIGSRASASEGFYGPVFNAYGSVIFYAGLNGTDRGFTANTQSLANSSSVAPVSTGGCGTQPMEFNDKYDGDRGTCKYAGYSLDVHFRCPFPGTTNDTPSPCWGQVYYGMFFRACVERLLIQLSPPACMNTGLPGVADDQGVIFYGNATTAVPPANCCLIDLVVECP